MEILAVLIEGRKNRRGVRIRELIDAVYAGHIGPIPDSAAGVVMVTISRARPKLHQLGWDIAGPKETGYGYALVELERTGS